MEREDVTSGLYLYDAVSSRDLMRFALHSGIHTEVMACYNVATAADGHIDRSKAAENCPHWALWPPPLVKVSKVPCPRSQTYVAIRSWNWTHDFQTTGQQLYHWATISQTTTKQLLPQDYVNEKNWWIRFQIYDGTTQCRQDGNWSRKSLSSC